jgi:hypothetical protein
MSRWVLVPPMLTNTDGLEVRLYQRSSVLVSPPDTMWSVQPHRDFADFQRISGSIRCIRRQELLLPLPNPPMVFPNGRSGRYPLGLYPEIRPRPSRTIQDNLARGYIQHHQQVVFYPVVMVELFRSCRHLVWGFELDWWE